MKIVKMAFVLCLVVFLAGCTSRSIENRMSVESTLNPEGNYGNYQTFSWVNYNTDQIIIKDPQLRAKVVEAIENALKSRGLTYDPKNPDLMVGYHGAVEQKLDEERLAAYYGDSDYTLDSDAKFNKIESWDVGTLVLMIFDAKDGTMLWQASAQAELDERASESQRKQNLQKVVQAMLATLPTEKDIEDVMKQKKSQ
jgi:hypothetical protein